MNWNENIEVFNEDCMLTMSRYEDNYFDLAIIDPPYGINESGQTNKTRAKLAKSKDYGNKNWDKSPPNKDYFIELKRVSKNQIIWGGNHFIENIPSANSSCWIVWDKDNGKTDFADCELAWCSFKTAVRKIQLRWQGMLQHNMKNKQVRIHPTEKPIALYQWIYQKYAKPNFKIIDTHFGSGSNGIALDSMNKIENMNLTLVASEKDKDYYRESKERFYQQTKQLSIFSP